MPVYKTRFDDSVLKEWNLGLRKTNRVPVNVIIFQTGLWRGGLIKPRKKCATEYRSLMTVLILIKHESAYAEKKIIHIRHSKPEFSLSIQTYLFIYSNMKYRGSHQYIHKNNGYCNISETESMIWQY